MTNVDTTAAIHSLRTLKNALLFAVSETARVTLDEVERHAKATTLWQDQTGRTRASIHAVRETVSSGFVVAGGASRFLEFGTPPHQIWGKNGGLLTFQINGQWISKRMVNHPGTAERPFMSQARDFGQQIADYSAEYFIERAIRAHQ